MRLTNDIRNNVIQAVLKAKFSKRKEALDREDNKLAMLALKERIGPKNLKLCDELDEIFTKEISSINIAVPGLSRVHFSFDKDVRVPAGFPQHSTNGAQGNAKSKSAIERFIKHSRARDELGNEREGLRRKLRTVLYSVTTAKRAIETLPEIAPYMPNGAVPAAGVPAELVADLAKLIPAPSKEKANAL
jgi:hypothetical protein